MFKPVEIVAKFENGGWFVHPVGQPEEWAACTNLGRALFSLADRQGLVLDKDAKPIEFIVTDYGREVPDG